MSPLPAPDSVEDLEIALLLEGLFQRYHYDFRRYARASIKRRLVPVSYTHLTLPTNREV